MDAVVQAVRRFNRFYTAKIGVLTDHLLDSEYTLTRVRILYEIEHGEEPTAAAIAQDLRLDRGYMSRILQGFLRQGVIRRTASPRDGRASLLALTAKGRKVFQALDTRANAQVTELLRQVGGRDRARLVDAMRTIQEVLSPTGEPPFILRQPRAGDLGWVVHRHGTLYAREYRYDQRFEALVARIVGDFGEHHDPARERCWIAETGGDVAGSVFLVHAADNVAKLRLLYVEPSARGRGIGQALVSACVDFARAAGYRTVTLWTQSELLAARRIYARAGFVCVKEEPQPNFGRADLVSETWELALEGEARRTGRPRPV